MSLMSSSPAFSTPDINLKDPRFAQRYKQELLKINAKRMVLFCVVYVAMQLGTLLSGITATRVGGATNMASVLLDGGAWTGLTIVAAIVGAVFALLFVLITLDFIRMPRIQNTVFLMALIVLSVLQFVLCLYEVNYSAFSVCFLLYLLLLGILPILSRVQSVVFIVVFSLASWVLIGWGTPPGAPTPLTSGVPELAFGPSGGFLANAAADSSLLLTPIVVLVSIAASWFNSSLVKKNIAAGLELEQVHELTESLIAERTAEYKEEARLAEAANQAKSRFLTRVSHEMRTSMTTISGMAFLARETSDAASRQESLEAIGQASQKLKDVVDKLIDTTQLESDLAEGVFDQDNTLLSSDAAPSKHKEEQVAPPDLTGKNILVVEDLPTNRLVLLEFLRDTHAQVEEAENGREAVEMFSASPEGYYSFVFMDLLMPEMNGHDATRAIRRMERSDAVTVPIVAVSANAFNEDIEASLAAGMDAHLAKPVEQSTIFRTLIERLA